jgi:mannose-1-phosphate guanylyltransferase/mannose-6-phosphate isomerase
MRADGVRLAPVILAGGIGERLWPVSTPDLPKQFIIRGPRGHSLFQLAVLRARAMGSSVPTVIVCAAHHERVARQQMAALGGDGAAHFIIEPEGKNTAPAITLAALHLGQKQPDVLIMVLPADHYIDREDVLVRAVGEACACIATDDIVLFAACPSHPSTEYGYIQCARKLDSAISMQPVIRFVEKPPLAEAQAYLAAGDYVWNGGMFLMAARTVLSEMRRAAPAVYAACEVAYARASVRYESIYPDETSYACAPRISFDRAVMESTEHAQVMTLDMGWDDLGSWQSLEKFHRQHATQKVAASPDALGLQAMQMAGVTRPWGRFVWVDEGLGYKVKKLYIRAGCSLSLQVHQHRSEHWVVVQGTATVTCGERTFDLQSNESTFIASGEKHRLRNATAEELVVIEVQVGLHLSEEDITRFSDAAVGSQS